MDITYIHQYFNTPSMPGSTRSYEISRRLIADGHTVRVVTSDMRGRRNGRQGERVTDESGIQVNWLPVPYGNHMPYARRAIAFVEFALRAWRCAARHPADILIATSTPLTVGLPAMAVKRTQGTKFIFEVRDLWPDVPIAMGLLPKAMQRPLKVLERKTYQRADAIVCLSPEVAQKLRGRALGTPIFVAPNGCDEALRREPVASDAPLAALQAIPAGHRIVLYPGTLGPVNGPSYLVELAEELLRRDSNTCVVAVGGGKLEDQVRASASQRGVLGRSFFMLPHIPKAAMPGLLARADIIISTVAPIPALAMNCANKIFDGLAAGRPVAVNHEGWIATMIREERCGVVLKEQDVVNAAETLIRLLSDDRWVQETRSNARRLATTDYSRDRIYGEIRRAIDAVRA